MWAKYAVCVEGRSKEYWRNHNLKTPSDMFMPNMAPRIEMADFTNWMAKTLNTLPMACGIQIAHEESSSYQIWWKNVRCGWNRRKVYQSQFKSLFMVLLHYFSLKHLKKLFKNLLATDQWKLSANMRKWPVNRSKLPVIFWVMELQQVLSLLRSKSYTRCNSLRTYLHKFLSLLI